MPDIRVQDEQGNIHVFPDGSTPEMISKAMNVKPPDAVPVSEQPGMFTRFGQALGLPTSSAELEALGQKESSLPWYKKIIPHMPGTDPGLANVVLGPGAAQVGRSAIDYGKTAYKGIKEAGTQAYQTGQELARGEISGKQAAGKAADAALHAGLQATPIIGPTIETMGQDAANKNWGGFAGGGLGVATQILGPKMAEATAPMISKVTQPVAERLYQSALKPSTTLPFLKRDALVKTGLQSGIPVSPSGAEKLGALIDNLNQTIADQIHSGSQGGATVDPAAVAARADQIKPQFANQVNPTSDLAAINAAKQEFLANNPGPISAEDAQAMKQGTYKQLKGRAYGELKGATVEAQKALARGLKEELETQFPEIKGMNAQESQYIGLDSALERALNRIGNHQLIGIGTPIVGGAVAGATHSGPAGIVAGVMKALVDDPMVKSRLAIALQRSGRVPPWMAAARIAQVSKALSPQQQTEQTQ